MPASAEPELADPTPSIEDSDSGAIDDGDGDDEFVMIQRSISAKRREAKGNCPDTRLQELLPFPFAPNIRPLTISDLQSCVALENAAFPHPEHRATPEKFEYRLTTCPELSLGIFCTVVPDHAKDFQVETLAAAHPVETDRPDHAVSVLLAHVIATASDSAVVTDKDMSIPGDWRAAHGKKAEVGHQEGGRTVCIHSLAVSPKLHGCGLGKLIMKSYLQQINNSSAADRVALICQDYLVSYYERFGFKHQGESKAEFGGGGWHDMIFDFASSDKPPN